jgi:hypothetical protein
MYQPFLGFYERPIVFLNPHGIAQYGRYLKDFGNEVLSVFLIRKPAPLILKPAPLILSFPVSCSGLGPASLLVFCLLGRGRLSLIFFPVVMLSHLHLRSPSMLRCGEVPAEGFIELKLNLDWDSQRSDMCCNGVETLRRGARRLLRFCAGCGVILALSQMMEMWVAFLPVSTSKSVKKVLRASLMLGSILSMEGRWGFVVIIWLDSQQIQSSNFSKLCASELWSIYGCCRPHWLWWHRFIPAAAGLRVREHQGEHQTSRGRLLDGRLVQ